MSEETANSANSAENTDANLRIMQGGHSAGHWFHRYLAAQDRYEITLRRLREAEAERDTLREALEPFAQVKVHPGYQDWAIVVATLRADAFRKAKAARQTVTYCHDLAGKPNKINGGTR